MKKKWETDELRDRMTCERHPNWNPNCEEVEKPYCPGWYGEKDEHIKALRAEQSNRDAFIGDKFKDNDTLVRDFFNFKEVIYSTLYKSVKQF